MNAIISLSTLLLWRQDDQLRHIVNIFGSHDWPLLSSIFPDRSEVQCQHRWQKVLNPELIKGPWTKEVKLKDFLIGLLNARACVCGVMV